MCVKRVMPKSVENITERDKDGSSVMGSQGRCSLSVTGDGGLDSSVTDDHGGEVVLPENILRHIQCG